MTNLPVRDVSLCAGETDETASHHTPAAVSGYPVETVAQAIADVLQMGLAGARLVPCWALEAPEIIEAPPLSEAQVEAILARLR